MPRAALRLMKFEKSRSAAQADQFQSDRDSTDSDAHTKIIRQGLHIAAGWFLSVSGASLKMIARRESCPSFDPVHPDAVLLRRPYFPQVEQLAETKAEPLLVEFGQLFQIVPRAQAALKDIQYSLLW
jgi:hypothetical protein